MFRGFFGYNLDVIVLLVCMVSQHSLGEHFLPLVCISIIAIHQHLQMVFLEILRDNMTNPSA